MLLYLRIDREGPTRGKPTLIYKCKLAEILTCELTKVGSAKLGYVHVMAIVSSKQGSEDVSSYHFQSPDFSEFGKIFDLISLSPICESTDKVRGINRIKRI
jgi:hypothetical protein